MKQQNDSVYDTQSKEKKYQKKICMVAALLKQTKRKNNKRRNYKPSHVRTLIC